MATLLPEGKQSFTDGAGKPLVGGKLYTYDAGTSTPRPTYADAAGTIANTNPVVLDARGEATVFWQGAYKAVLKDASGVTVWTVDHVRDEGAALALDLLDTAPGKGAKLVGFRQGGAGAVARTLQDKSMEVVSVKDFGAVGDGVTDDTAAFQALATYCNNTAFKSIVIPPGLYVVNTTISFQRLWFFKIDAMGANITPKTGVTWAQKPIIEFCSCYVGDIHGLAIQSNMTNGAAWAAVSPKTNLPTCGLMLRRMPGSATIAGLGITGGDSNQNLNFYHSYIKGYFEKAALVNTCSETIYFEGGVIGGMACSAVLDTATPSQVYQPAVTISNRDKKFKNVEFHMEEYAVPAVTAPCIGLYDAVLDFSLVNCYFALGGMQSISDVAAGILLGQTTGAGGFTNIVVEDCYGENAGDKFAFMDIQTYDIHDIRICGWRHSQTAGSSDAVVRYRGSTAATDAALHLERIRPPSNATNLVKIDQDISPVTIKNARGLLTAASGKYIYNADLRMVADDVYNSAPAASYTVSALLPGNYTLFMDRYPVSSGFARQRPMARGSTTLTSTSATNCLFHFNRESANVFDVALTGGLTTVEGPASWRSYQDTGTAYDFIGNSEVFYLSFTSSTTLKHNFKPNSAYYFILKSGADTTYAAGRIACFVRNGDVAVEV